MIVVGIDLSGPSNTADTSVVVFSEKGSFLSLVDSIDGTTDADIFRMASRLPSEERIVIGLDAPLSYNPGGGDRPSDKLLRKACIAKGMHPGSVMTPTNPRMAYLTLRGVAVARLLELSGHTQVDIVEVHPGAAMTLGGASVDDVKAIKGDQSARIRMLSWLEGEGLVGASVNPQSSDHTVAAYACALAAWKWVKGNSAWLHKAEVPHHPYDFAC